MPRWHAILVHGAWQGGWAWAAFAPRLRARGAIVDAVDLPGAWAEREDVRFDEQVDALVAAIDAVPHERPLVVVAHSGGTLVAAQAAERRASRIALLVSVAGILPPSGATLGTVIAGLVAEGHDPDALAGIRPHLRWSPDGRASTVSADAAASIFLHDCAPEVARAAASRLVPQSEAARGGVPVLTSAGFGRVPLVYVVALRDRSIAPVVQRRMCEGVPGAQVLSIDAGHAPQLSRPEALDALLVGPIEAHVAGWRPAPR